MLNGVSYEHRDLYTQQRCVKWKIAAATLHLRGGTGCPFSSACFLAKSSFESVYSTSNHTLTVMLEDVEEKSRVLTKDWLARNALLNDGGAACNDLNKHGVAARRGML